MKTISMDMLKYALNQGYATKIKAHASRKSGMLQRSVGQLLESCLDCSCSTWKTLKKPTPRKINGWNLKMDGLVQMIFLKTRGSLFSGEPAVNLPGWYHFFFEGGILRFENSYIHGFFSKKRRQVG